MAKKASPPKPKPKPKPSRSVRIRMYRQGLGDCFLITFQIGSAKTHAVIDCGVLSGSPKGSDRIQKAVADIQKETRGTIDLLIATHEHADHLSGFNQAQATWNEMTVKKTWLAWTEDLASPAVASMKKRQEMRMAAIVAGEAKLAKEAGQLSATSPDDPQTKQKDKLERGAATLRNLLRFSLDEDDDPPDVLKAQSKPSGPSRALQWLKERAGTNLEYCHPSHPPRPLPGRDDVTVYVLGPPDGPLLRYEDPDRPGEGYLVRGSLTGDACFGLAAVDADLLKPKSAVANPALFGQKNADAASPFDPFYQLAFDKVKDAKPGSELGEAHVFFKERYGFGDADKAPYRRIDHDWLGFAESMALSQISYVNNTSLVLAFELVEGGPVLLFPGDAQIGSWLSWKDLSWEVGTGSQRRTVTGPDLLKQTVFYKVGHHGSHNATLKEGGLEVMTNPELVAFIPVHQGTAKSHDWVMPWGNLRTKLNTSNVAGRVILSDQDEAKDMQTKPPDSATGPAADRWAAFTGALTWDTSPDTLWVDYTYHY